MPARQGNENKRLMLLNGHSNCTPCLQLNTVTTKAFSQLLLLIVVAGQVCIWEPYFKREKKKKKKKKEGGKKKRGLIILCYRPEFY